MKRKRPPFVVPDIFERCRETELRVKDALVCQVLLGGIFKFYEAAELFQDEETRTALMSAIATAKKVVVYRATAPEPRQKKPVPKP